jgi:hypothetical protein
MAIRRVFPIQRQAAVFAFAALMICPLASAQSFFKVPTIDVFAGYSYLRFDSKPLGFADQLNLNGWNAEIALPNLYQGFGVAADVSAHYAHELAAYNFLIGPQYTYEVKNLRVYGHALFGKSRDRLSFPGSTELEPSNLARDVALGGGVDIPIGGRLSWRAVQGDYVITSNFGGTQHNVRVSTGVVIRFGKH